ncbi:MAG TPA: ATP-binding protein [Pyrinomonadaceae bacterium]|nr:ATP-binding protein [Pyrinomonadaceae bacterium]
MIEPDGTNSLPSAEDLPEPNFRALFESAPGLYLVLLPNPQFTIIAVSNAYLRATMTKREEILGHRLFDVFPDNPDDPHATGESNLRASLERVIRTRGTDAMAIQKYDIRRPQSEGGGFEVRYWSPVNSPVMDEAGNCVYIIHRVEDVTEFVDVKQPDVEHDKRTQELAHRAESMEAEIFLRSLELNEANRQLRASNQGLEALSQSISQEKAAALAALGKSQEQLFLSQRLEAVGQLAGGVAHDFNNLLTVIGGYCDMMLEALDPVDANRQKVEEIQKAASRASSLTRQLLAFSRKQVLQPVVLNLNSVVADIEKMLTRVIGEDIEFRTNLQSDLGNVKADPGQIEQVIMNLAVNARDAMPAGGKTTIETANTYLDETYAQHHVAVIPGPFVMLAVSDTGVGMDEETKEHIFEPFFTTKALGKGTGLGLSTVYGIVKQSGGNIWVYSEIGKGSTFKVYLPRVDEMAKAYKQMPPSTSPGGTETILLVEDAEMVRKLTLEVLCTIGYRVLEAASGSEALQISESTEEPIDLLLTDVVMPEMSGKELANHLLSLRPEMKVLFMSGYTDDTIVYHGLLDKGLNFIEKPFAPDALARTVREVLQRD